MAEQARLLGMSASREAKLLARVAELEAVAEAVKQQYNTNPYATIHLSVYEAMRAAGYLK